MLAAEKTAQTGSMPPPDPGARPSGQEPSTGGAVSGPVGVSAAPAPSAAVNLARRPTGLPGLVQRLVGRVIGGLAEIAWRTVQFVNRRVAARSFQPKWAPAPLIGQPGTGVRRR